MSCDWIGFVVRYTARFVVERIATFGNGREQLTTAHHERLPFDPE